MHVFFKSAFWDVWVYFSENADDFRQPDYVETCMDGNCSVILHLLHRNGWYGFKILNI